MNNIDLLNNIDNVIIESEISVTMSLIDSYTKSIMILENYNGNDISSFDIFNESAIIQEGEILDAATGKDKAGENLFFKIIAFLPRLIIKLGSVIKNKLTGKEQEVPKEHVEQIEKALQESTPEEIEELATNAENSKVLENEKDSPAEKEKKKSFLADLKNGKMTISNKIKMFKHYTKFFNRLGNELNPFNDGEIKKFVKELSYIIQGLKQPDTVTLKVTSDAISGIYQDFSSGAHVLIDTIQTAADKATKLEEQMKNRPNVDQKTYSEKAQALRELSANITLFQKLFLDDMDKVMKPFGWLNRIINHDNLFKRRHPFASMAKTGLKKVKESNSEIRVGVWVKVKKAIDPDGNNIKKKLDATGVQQFRVVKLDGDIAELSINGKQSSKIFIRTQNLKRIKSVNLDDSPNVKNK